MRAQIRTLLTSSTLIRLRARLAHEAGMSLVLALGFMMIFSISTAAIVNELVMNESGAHRDQKMVTALAAAEAEMNFAAAWVQSTDQHDTMATGTVYPLSSSSPVSQLAAADSDTTYYFTGNPVSGATNTGWWAHKYPDAALGKTCHDLLSTLATTDHCWQVDGRAKIGMSTREVRIILTAPNHQTYTTYTPTSTPSTTNILTTGTVVTTVTGTVPQTSTDMTVWGFGAYSSGASVASSGCHIVLTGNITVKEPIYVPGNLCMVGNAVIAQNTSNNVTVYVKGTLSLSANNSVGSSTSKLTQVTAGSCTYKNGAVLCNNTAGSPGSHVWALAYYNTGPSVPKPAINLDTLYASADPGPMHPCSVAAGSTASSTWPTFDTNTVRNNSVTTTAGPFTASSYTCISATGGELDWNAGTQTLTLHNNTLFFDGSLSYSGNANVVYVGKASMYFDNTVSLSGNGSICVKSTCLQSDFTSSVMASNLLLIGAGNLGVTPATCGTSFTFSGNSVFQGVAYANGCIDEGGNAGVVGPAVADGYNIHGNASYYQPLGVNSLPPNAPQNVSTTYTTTLQASTTVNTNTTQSVTTVVDTTTTPNDYWGQLATSWQQLK